jgi:hypothetical protein
MNNDQLTDAEIAELRKLIEDDKRMRWLWASMRFHASWIAATVAAIVAFRDDIGSLIRFMFTGGRGP